MRNSRRKYRLYEKHLVFDCDAPDNIQEVIRLMKSSSNEYILDLSNLLFETWLVMHYQNIMPDDACGKREIIKYIRGYLEVNKYTSKEKAGVGTIGKILGNDGSRRIRAAIENAKELERYWNHKGYDIDLNIKSMNPCVKIHVLVERLLDEIVYLCK